MLTSTQVKTAEAIVNIFETSAVLGNYSAVTLIDGDTGHLTYGRSQTTLSSGNLHALIDAYVANAGARFAARLSPYLASLRDKDTKLDKDLRLHNLLRAAADDPVMRETQDAFFTETYWEPALHAATQAGIASALGAAVVYDSFVHGSWKLIRDGVNQQQGSVAALGEQAWISAYVDARRKWLAHHEREDLRATVYRMDAFRRLIDQGFWGLALPIVVRGQEISLTTLAATPAGCYDGPQPGTRQLALASPLMRGLDIRLTQLGLSEAGIDVKADGIYGQTSMRLIKEYQAAHGLPATGVADVALIATLAK